MTTPHPEQPAEGPADVPAAEGDPAGDEPSNPDRTGESIDSSTDTADSARAGELGSAG